MHAETMFKDWWKKLSEELIPDTQPDRFILVEQKPELDLEQEEKTEPDPLQIKRRRSNLEIITEMLNNNITEVTCSCFFFTFFNLLPHFRFLCLFCNLSRAGNFRMVDIRINV